MTGSGRFTVEYDPKAVKEHRLRTFDEIAEALRNAPPPTRDDVSITRDGERLDSAEKVRAWVARENALRAEQERQGKDGSNV